MKLNSLKNIILLTFVLVMCSESAAQSILPSLGSSRSGTSGFQFLKINVDPRASALGNSSVADAIDGSSLYSNPALSSQIIGSQVFMSHTAYFADISMNYLSYIHRFQGNALGFSLQYLDSGSINETTEFNPFGTGRTFRTIHMAAGLSFSQQLTNLFSYGITAKYLNERIENVDIQSVVFDFGFFYRVGDTNLRFAVGISNFGFDANPSGETSRLTLDGVVVETDFERVSPPTTFNLGAAYDLVQNDTYRILLTGQLSNPSDNSERFSLGTEFEFMQQFFLRTGYEFGVDEAILPSFGAGFNLPFSPLELSVNYGFSSRERLGSLHRIGLSISL